MALPCLALIACVAGNNGSPATGTQTSALHDDDNDKPHFCHFRDGDSRDEDSDGRHRCVRRPVIIEAAINGTTTTAQNPNTPRTNDAIVADAIAVMNAGAAIVHTHSNEGAGTPVENPAPYIDEYTRIKTAFPNAILFPTLSSTLANPQTAAPVAPALAFNHVTALDDAGLLRMGLATGGSADFATFTSTVLDTGAGELVYYHSPSDTRFFLDTMRARHLSAILTVQDWSFMRLIQGYQRQGGVIPDGSAMEWFFTVAPLAAGAHGPEKLYSAPATKEAFNAYLAQNAAFSNPLPYTVVVQGGDVTTTLGPYALDKGADSIRVGLEDYDGPDRPTNVQLVERALDLLEDHGCRAATIDEAATMLHLQK